MEFTAEIAKNPEGKKQFWPARHWPGSATPATRWAAICFACLRMFVVDLKWKSKSIACMTTDLLMGE
jgi:hypothetical protein